MISCFRSLMTCTFPVALCVCLAPSVFGHGGVGMYDDGSQIGVGLATMPDGVTPIITPGLPVFESFLIPETLPPHISPFDFSASNPGFRVLDSGLPPNQAISLTHVSLSFWDGVGPVLFMPEANVTFGFELSDCFGTDDVGGMHEHPLFGLSNGTVADGVYVGEFFAGTAGLDDSDSIFFVMLKDDLLASEDDVTTLKAALDLYENDGTAPMLGGKDFAFYVDAVEFVESWIPEPSTALIACMGIVFGLGAFLRRRS